MVRTYVRKSHRKPYTNEDLKEACRQCRSGRLTIKGCARAYKIPRETLRDHLKGRRGESSGGGGRSTAISAEKEVELAMCLKEMTRNGFGLSRTEVLDIVQLYVQTHQLNTSFKNGRPGEDWWLRFKKTHNLCLKKPEPLEHVRANQSNPYIIYGFFDLLEMTVHNLGLDEKPGQIWNCDETSFCTDPSKTKVVSAKGKTCHRKTAGTGRENITVLACVNAEGQKLPPLVIFKGKSLWDTWVPKEGDYPNTAYSASEKGWMTVNLFENWFIRQYIPAIGPERPVLLIFDGHVSHVSPQVIKAAREENITILKLPARTTHLLQPLDVACFRGLKVKWDKDLVAWQRRNPRQKLPKSEFAKLVGGGWVSLTENNIKSGFKCSGIYDPDSQNETKVNRNAISTNLFSKADLQSYRSSKGNNNIAPVDEEAPKIDEQPGPSVSQASDTTINTNSPLQQTGERSFADLILDTFRPVAQKSAPTKRRKVSNTAEVLTSTDISELQRESNIKQKLPTRKSVVEDVSSTSSDGSLCLDDEEDGEGESDNIEQEDQDFHLEEGDFVQVQFPLKKTIRYYVGQIVGIETTDQYDVKFLRCDEKNKSRFKWPAEEDTSTVCLKDIIQKLPKPHLDRRQRLLFGYDFSNVNIC